MPVMNMKCRKCSADLAFELPAPEIINRVQVSMLVWAHGAEQCTACGQHYVFVVAGISPDGRLVVGFNPVDLQTPSGLSIPGSRIIQ